MTRASAATDTFARLFEAVHEGVYIGTLEGDESTTLSANPYLKLMFGFAAETPQADVRPFDPDRFVDPQAREGFVEAIQRDRAVRNYLMRLRRADRTPIWVEVTASRARQAACGSKP
jgi:PAS domain-containing protein